MVIQGLQRVPTVLRDSPGSPHAFYYKQDGLHHLEALLQHSNVSHLVGDPDCRVALPRILYVRTYWACCVGSQLSVGDLKYMDC